MLVNGKGVPLAITVSGANVHDVTMMEVTLDAIQVEIPWDQTMHLCADAGYVGAEHEITMMQHGYLPHVKSRGDEKKELQRKPEQKARRWVVEACHSWINKFRKLLVRFEKTANSYLGLLHFACAIITWRKVV